MYIHPFSREFLRIFNDEIWIILILGVTLSTAYDRCKY